MVADRDGVTALLREQCAALGEYVCPIYIIERENGFLIGSGIPIEIGSVRLIATATHVLEEAERRGQHILTAGYERPFRLSGEWRGYKHKPGYTVDVDMSVVLLNDHEWTELKRRFSSTSRKDLGELPSEVDYFAVVGYPHSKNKPTPRSRYHLEPHVTYVASNMKGDISVDATLGKYDNVHFAISADSRRTISPDVAFPRPTGMSGGGVWNLRLRETLTQRGTPQLVGIGIEYDRATRSFICTRIEPIFRMIEDLVG